MTHSAHTARSAVMLLKAADAEQAGWLARQQEIKHLGREIKAAQLLVDQATAQGARAEAAWQRVSGSMAPARGRVADLTRHLHDVQLDHSRTRQQASQSNDPQARPSVHLAEIMQQADELRAPRHAGDSRFDKLALTLGDHHYSVAGRVTWGSGLGR